VAVEAATLGKAFSWVFLENLTRKKEKGEVTGEKGGHDPIKSKIREFMT